jgi:tRNA-2-methylthio-N6-dimethylallyladenosine synthase
MNKSDSELMELSFKSEGFVSAPSAEGADVVVFNTCSVRKNAEDRATSRLRQARAHQHKGAVMVLAGCMAQRTGDDFVKKKWADIVIGPYQAPRIGKIVNELLHGKKIASVYTSQDPALFSPRIDEGLLTGQKESPRHTWVTITHGCENFCTYCIVPYVRGALISFPSASILSHLESLVKSGVTEITLLGQNVNQYGQDSGDIPFYKLLESAGRISGLSRVSFLTSHPKDFCEDTVKVIRDNPVLSRGIHLPLQSGSDEILSRMNRKYTWTHYLKLIEWIERYLGNEAGITTDLIVGFPGETEAHFRQTLDAVRRVRFSDAFTYAYSPREGTAAASFPDDISHAEKIRRLNELITVERGIITQRRLERLGRTDRVIGESLNSKDSSQLIGRNDLGQTVVYAGDADGIGVARNVVIERVHGSTLIGNVVS